MDITVIGPIKPYKGGVSQYNTHLCNSLKNKFNLKIISFKRLYLKLFYPGTEQKDNTSKLDAEYSLDSINPLTWFKAAYKIKKEDPDLVIFVWGTLPWAPAYFILEILTKYLTKAKILFSCHNIMQHENYPFNIPLTKLALAYSNYYIVHSKEDKNNLLKLFPNASVKNLFLPMFQALNTKQITKQKAKKELNLKGNTILFFGFIRSYKGLKYLIKALPIINKKVKLKLIIVGEFWEDKETYISLIKNLKLKNITLVDHYISNNKLRYINASDIIVLPYTTATQSAVVQTAYSFNKPVIVTNVGGLPEVVEDKKTGIVVEPKDFSAIANAIIYFYKNKKEKSFSKNIATYKKRFIWDKYVETIESFFKQK